MLTRAGTWARGVSLGFRPWTSVVGVARSTLALATAATLAFNDRHVLFPAVPRSMLPPPYCGGVRAASVFCQVPMSAVDAVRWVLVALLLVVASGYRPRLTGVLHAYIAFSFAATSPLLDGGDQVAAVLTLLLLPITLTDPRRWHWDPPPPGDRPYGGLLSFFASWLVRLQVAGIYLHAGVGKMAVDDWANGTALHYWLRHPIVGVAEPYARWLLPLTSHGAPLALLTWGVIALELLLGVAFLTSPRLQRVLLPLGLALHLAILVLHGLVSFALIMMAALLLYLRPLGAPLRWPLARSSGGRRQTEPARLPLDNAPGAGAEALRHA